MPRNQFLKCKLPQSYCPGIRDHAILCASGLRWPWACKGLAMTNQKIPFFDLTHERHSRHPLFYRRVRAEVDLGKWTKLGSLEQRSYRSAAIMAAIVSAQADRGCDLGRGKALPMELLGAGRRCPVTAEQRAGEPVWRIMGKKAETLKKCEYAWTNLQAFQKATAT